MLRLDRHGLANERRAEGCGGVDVTRTRGRAVRTVPHLLTVGAGETKHYVASLYVVERARAGAEVDSIAEPLERELVMIAHASAVITYYLGWVQALELRPSISLVDSLVTGRKMDRIPERRVDGCPMRHATLLLLACSSCTASAGPRTHVAPVTSQPTLQLECPQQIYKLDAPIICEIVLRNDADTRICLNARMWTDRVNRPSTDILVEVRYLRTGAEVVPAHHPNIFGRAAQNTDYRCLAQGEEVRRESNLLYYMGAEAGDFVIRLHYDTLDDEVTLPAAWRGVLDAEAIVHLAN